MISTSTKQKLRKRAPSQRSIATRERILDAAERVFAAKGFDGASMRDIAKEAGEQVGLVHHHGGGKEELFHQTIARRANELSAARLAALAKAQSSGEMTPHVLFRAFFAPFMALAGAGPQWLAYARLVAHVSADPRWNDIAAECFDPTARIFIDEMEALLPETSRQVIATGFVFAVSAMLALLTSNWRIVALGNGVPDMSNQLEHLINYSAAGMTAGN